MKLYKKIFILLMLNIIAVSFCINCSTGSNKRKEEHEARQKVIKEIEYGRLLATQIIKKYSLLEDEKAVLYVSKVGKSVALFAGRSDIEYHFAILDTESINAYATPGGYVFITKGALALMKNEAELAGVLAHEIGHINHRHIMKELPPPRETGGFVDRAAALLVSSGSVVSSAFTEVVNNATELLFSKGYKIEDEFEADRSAVYYTSETGYYPNGLIHFLKRIREKENKKKDSLVYNTHPSAAKRIKRLITLLSTEKFDTKRPKVASRFMSNLGHIK